MKVNKKSKKTKLPIIVLSVLCIISGLSIVYGLVIKFDMQDTKGRVLRWDGDDAYLKFEAEPGDSILVKAHIPYTRNKKKLNTYNEVPVRFSSLAPSYFEIEGVVHYTLYSEVFLFCIFGYGLVKLLVNSKKELPPNN